MTRICSSRDDSPISEQSLHIGLRTAFGQSSLLFVFVFFFAHCLRTEQSLRAVMVRCVCGIYMAAACQGLVMPKVTEGKMPLSNLVNGF